MDGQITRSLYRAMPEAGMTKKRYISPNKLKNTAVYKYRICTKNGILWTNLLGYNFDSILVVLETITGNFFHYQLAVGTAGEEAQCISDTAYERQSPPLTLSFHSIILP